MRRHRPDRARRPPLDVLGAEVREVEDERGERFFVLALEVNDVDITVAGAGLGMDPHTLLVPTNRLAASPLPHLAPVARCTCGEYGCGSTDVTITRLARTVRWDWQGSPPMGRPALFDADQYDETVELLSDDWSWETPGRTASRLILCDHEPGPMAHHGLRLHWAGDHWSDPSTFQVSVLLRDEFQVFLRLPWGGRAPEQMAEQVKQLLERTPPQDWPARWNAIRVGSPATPQIAGPHWAPDRG